MKIFKKSAALIFTLLMSLSLLASCSSAPEKKEEESEVQSAHFRAAEGATDIY